MNGQPRMSRRHAAGAESARGLLFTVLGEFVLPSGEAAWTSSFIEVFGRMGVEEKAIRQALMRTAADGWLKPERAGRRTLWQLTPAAERLLSEGTERIYGFAAAARDWDGRWLLVLARAPETDRRARHLLRTRLSWAGFGSPAPGVWISPHTDRTPDAENALAEAGLSADAQVFTAEHHPGPCGGEPGARLPAMIRQAWDLDALDGRYKAFIAEFGRSADGRAADGSSADGSSADGRAADGRAADGRADGRAADGSSADGRAGAPGAAGAPAGTADPLVRVIELVHAWRRFPWTDPELPTPLLPPRWSGVEAARLFARLHARWSPDAAAGWRRLDERPAEPAAR